MKFRIIAGLSAVVAAFALFVTAEKSVPAHPADFRDSPSGIFDSLSGNHPSETGGVLPVPLPAPAGDHAGVGGAGAPGPSTAPGNALPTESEIADVVKAQGFDFDNIGIVITYFSPSNRQVSYQHNPNMWWYPASTTKVVILTYAYYDAYVHRHPGEDFDQEAISADDPYISKMIRASDNDSTTRLAKKYGKDKIQSFPRQVLGYAGIETGWKLLSGPDRVTALGMNRLMSYIYDDLDTGAIALPVKKKIRNWLERPKVGQLGIQNKPILHFLNDPGLPNPYDPQSGLTVGMKGGWTDDVGSGHVACFNWRTQGSRWTVTVYREGNWGYFGKIGTLHRDLFLLFKDKR